MPRKTVRFQNKQGDWKSTSKQYGNLPKYVKRSMRTRQRLTKQTQPQQKVRIQPTKTQENINTQANTVVVKEFGKKRETRRQDVTTYEDEAGNTIVIQQSEEGARYTPSQTVTVAQEEEEGTIAITKISKRNPRKVSETRVSVLPSQDQFNLALDLEDRFKRWNKTKDSEDRLSIAELRLIAKNENVPSAGITRPTLEKRIRKKIIKGGEK